MNRYFKVSLMTLCCAAVLGVAVAQMGPMSPQQRADRAVQLRQAVMMVQGFSFGPVSAMLRPERAAPFDAAVVEKAAQRLQVTSGMIADVFATDTSASQLPNKAEAAIWTDKAGFDMDVHEIQEAAAALESAAKTGDKDATLKAAFAVGKACGGCHNKFRAK